MTVRYQMTEQEAVQGILKVRSRNPASKRGTMVGILFGVGLVLLVAAFPPGPRGDAYHIFAPVVVALAIYVAGLLVRRHTKDVIVRHVYSNAHLYTVAYTLTFSEAGLSFAPLSSNKNSPGRSSNTAWKTNTISICTAIIQV